MNAFFYGCHPGAMYQDRYQSPIRSWKEWRVQAWKFPCKTGCFSISIDFRLRESFRFLA